MKTSVARKLAVAAIGCLLMLPLLVSTCSNEVKPAPSTGEPLSDILTAGQ